MLNFIACALCVISAIHYAANKHIGLANISATLAIANLPFAIDWIISNLR